jgi:hypothetical protein
MSRVEEGVMIMKNGKAWGETYSDGQATEYGWMAPEKAPIRDPRFCTKTTDVVHAASSSIPELQTGKLVKVRRTTTVEIID